MKFTTTLLTAAAAVAYANTNIGPEKAFNAAEYVKVKDTRNMFYWFFESRSNPATDPVVLWMTGGPGCSGLVALFKENGPYTVARNASGHVDFVNNPYSWSNNATLIFVDQPVGTGMSYDDSWIDPGVLDEAAMASDMWDLLHGFLRKYPKFARNPFFIAAESYGGHYAPALAQWIMDHNPTVSVPINLQGILVGNGLVDPYHQYAAYPTYAEQKNLVNSYVISAMKLALVPCQMLIARCAGTEQAAFHAAVLSGRRPSSFNESEWISCILAYQECNLGEVLPIQLTGVNLYDVRKPCEVPPLCYDMSDVGELLNRADIKEALGVTTAWTACNRIVTLKLVFAGDWMLSFSSAIRNLLHSGRRVLIYHGVEDYIVNWLGGEMWVNALAWDGQDRFRELQLNQSFVVDGQRAGIYKTHKGFTFLNVFEAGHMVPMDQPNAALRMLNRFTGIE